MKIVIGETEIGVKLVESRAKTLAITIPANGDISAVFNAVEGASEIDYKTGDGELVYKLYGTYKLSMVGGTGEGFVMSFAKSDTLETRIAALEAENAALKTELLDTQEALAELVEGGAENG